MLLIYVRDELNGPEWTPIELETLPSDCRDPLRINGCLDSVMAGFPCTEVRKSEWQGTTLMIYCRETEGRHRSWIKATYPQ